MAREDRELSARHNPVYDRRRESQLIQGRDDEPEDAPMNGPSQGFRITENHIKLSDKSLIDQKMDTVARLLNQVDSTVEALIVRLAPVCRPEREEKDDVSDFRTPTDGRPLAPLASSLEIRIEHLNDILFKLNRAIDDLEI